MVLIVVVQLIKIITPTTVYYHWVHQENCCTNLLMMLVNHLLLLQCSECQVLQQCTQHHSSACWFGDGHFLIELRPFLLIQTLVLFSPICLHCCSPFRSHGAYPAGFSVSGTVVNHKTLIRIACN